MLYIEDQLIKIDGVVLPGLVKSIEVKESAKIDEQEVEGSSTKPKQATGYEDAKINIELILDDTPNQTKYQRLEVLRAIFRKPGQSVPQPLSVVSEDTAKHGIDKVLFKGLSHKSESKKDQLAVSLELWEYIPQTIQARKSSGTAQTDTSAAAANTLTEDYRSYLVARREDKRGSSPAVDDASAAAAVDRVLQLPY